MLEAIDPFGQRRDDLRIALLAQTLVEVLGGRKADGQRFTAVDFLRWLDTEASAPLVPAQTAAQIEARIDAWCRGSNAILKEGGGRR